MFVSEKTLNNAVMPQKFVVLIVLADKMVTKHECAFYNKSGSESSPRFITYLVEMTQVLVHTQSVGANTLRGKVNRFHMSNEDISKASAS